MPSQRGPGLVGDVRVAALLAESDHNVQDTTRARPVHGLGVG